MTKLKEASEINFKYVPSIMDSPNERFHLGIDSEKYQKIKEVIGYDEIGNDVVKNQIDEFKKNLSRAVLYSYDVQRTDSKGKYIIKNLFEAYYTNPQQLPDNALKNL